LLRLLDALADRHLIVVDESFIDFADEDEVPSLADEAARRDNVLVLKSLGKNCGLHGIRAGYAVAHPRLAARLRRALPPWNVNALAEALIRELRGHLAEYEAARRRAVADRRWMQRRLGSVPGLTVFPSRANFVYVRVPEPVDGVTLRNWLLCEYGYLVRECGNKLGSDSRHFRLAVRPPPQAEALVAALTSAFRHFLPSQSVESSDCGSRIDRSRPE
jgi:histidinol-phosphate/aromatic aminotransferase/cobyric acid decarboxylase-like protein